MSRYLIPAVFQIQFFLTPMLRIRIRLDPFHFCQPD